MGKTCAQSLIHLHTFTQCDITGLLRLSGKVSLIKLLQKTEALQNILSKLEDT